MVKNKIKDNLLTVIIICIVCSRTKNLLSLVLVGDRKVAYKLLQVVKYVKKNLK